MSQKVAFFAVLCLLVAYPIEAQEGVVTGVKDLVDQLYEQIQDRAHLRVAVGDFVDLEGSPVRIGQFLAEEMTTQFLKQGHLKLIERRLLALAARELRLNLPDIGVIDPDKAQRLGRMIGVDALVVGSITPLQRAMRVHVRLIATETGELLAGASTMIPAEGQMSGAMDKVAPSAWTTPSTPSLAKSSGLLPSSPFTPARPTGNLLTNGDFSQPCEVGWQRKVGDGQKGENTVEVITLDTGRVLHLRHVGESYTALWQRVPVEVLPGLTFEGSFQMKAWEGPAWGVTKIGTAGIRLRYEDKDGNSLGETNLLRTVKNVFADNPLTDVPQPPQSDGRTHQIFVEEGWQDGFRLDLFQEIRDYLPGVDLQRVVQIAVVLQVGGDEGDRCGAELWTNNLKLEYVQ